MRVYVQVVSCCLVKVLDSRLTDLFFFNGKTLPSFFIRTIESAEIFFRSAAVSGVSRVSSFAFSGIPEAAHRLTRFSTSRARWVIACSVTLFDARAPWRSPPLNLLGPGISRSNPALTAPAVEYVPNLKIVSEVQQPLYK